MKMNEQNRNLLILLSICVLTIFPLLGLTDYNTKGEPREAIVAYSMLEHGNWILPRNYGGEIALNLLFCIGVWLLFPLCAVKCPNTPPGFRLLWP